MFSSEKLQHFSIRKLTVGAASVLIGVSFLMNTNNREVHADTINETTQNNQAVNNSADTTQKAEPVKGAQEVPTQGFVKTKNANFQTGMTADQTKKVNQDTTTKSADLIQNADAETKIVESVSNNKINNQPSNVQNPDLSKQAQTVAESTSSTGKRTETPRLAENKIQTTNLLVVKQNRQKVETNLTENKVEKQDTDKLSASLKDGTTIVISRNTIGATGDTSPLTMQVVYHGVKQGDIYTITVPKGRAYGLIDPESQRLQAFGSTNVQYQKNAIEIINTFDKDANAGNVTSQTFTLMPANNYAGQSVMMNEIGEVIKTITIDKKGIDSSLDQASLNIKQFISPEMSPTFKRILPNSQISEVYNNTDYTYELKINETTGIQKGISWASGQVNNAVNWGTKITIPVPPDFVLNTDQTAIVNDFKRNGDQTTITQIGGKGGNIVINAPKGSGRQYADYVPAYRLVGHYENTQAGTTQANGKITIHQLVTRDDGSTYYIDRELDRWSENITSGKADSLSDINIGIIGYSPRNVIPTTVDQTRPINSFYFQNINAVNIENPHLTFNFDDNLRINRITTPVDQIKLPGLTNYQYTAQLSDGRTINGSIEAGKELATDNGVYIKNIVLTPNLLAAGAGMDQYDGKNQIKAYGSISDTLKSNDKVNTQMGGDYTVNINGQLIHKVIAKNIDCVQTIQEASANVAPFASQTKQAPGSIDSGYISIYRSDDSVKATTHVVEEPILYYVLPKYTSYNRNIGVTVPNSGAKVPPKVTTFMVDDHEVVKIDFTGTGDKISTVDNANTHVDLDNSVLAKQGTYKYAIYIESPKTAITNRKATDSSFYNPAFTEGKTDRVYEIDQGNWTIGSAVETGIVSGALGNQNAVSVSRGNSDDKGDPNMAFDFNVINRNGQLNDITAVIDLSDHDKNAFNFELTEPVTITEKETNDHTEILYSVDKFAKPDSTINYQPDLSNFKTADQMSKDDWKNVKTIAFKIGNLKQDSNSSVFRIHGRDNTLASDTGKSYSYSTYLFGAGISPSYASYLTNPSITISGKSTIKYQMHYTDDNGQDHTVELNDLNKTYNDNQSSMANKAAVINDFNNYAKAHDIIPANYKLGNVEIIDGNKTWQTAEPNKKIDFGEKIQYFADSDIVQINLVPKAKGSVKVIYHDDTNNTDLTDYGYNSGDQYEGTSVNYNSSNVDTVKNDLINKGYKYVSIDGTIPAKIIGNQNIAVAVHVRHGLVPVDENSQNKHGVPIRDLAKDVHETVHFVDENGNKLRDDNIQTRHYIRTVTVDLTNNQIVTNPATDIDWHLADNQGSDYSEVNAPVITGYFADKKTVPSTKVVQDEINQTVTYKKIGSVIAIDKDGHQLADPIQFANDKNDPTKAVAVNAPTVLNYHLVNSNDKVVKPNNDLTQDVKVVYAKDQGSVKVVFIDDTTGETLSNVGYDSGNIDFDTPITYKATDDLAKLTKQGYVYNSIDGNIPEKVVANQNIAVAVHVRHGLVPVDENSQNKHGVPIRDLAKDVHETVHFVDENGNKLRDDNIQTRHYIRTVTVDLTNNQIVTNPATDIDWHLADNQGSDYSEVNAPVITGYFADKKTVPSTKVVQDEINQTVTYKKIGSVIAIDKDGHQLADPIQFANDKNDPTKAVAVNAPTVLNYHLVNSNDKVVKPNNDLTQDVKVVYAKDQGSVKVVFIDDTTGETLSNVGYDSGNIDFDTPITYKATDDLAKLTKQGYVYNSIDGNIPEKVVANQNIAVAVHVRHGVIVITSKTPKDDLPANLDQNLAPNKLTKEVTLTVNYVNEDGTPFTGQVPENAKQTITFNGTAYVDKVTGKLVNVKTVDNQLIVDTDTTKTPAIVWTSNKTSFDKVLSPDEKGYHVDKVSDHADGKDVGTINDIKFDSANITITVSYSKDPAKKPDTEPEPQPEPQPQPQPKQEHDKNPDIVTDHVPRTNNTPSVIETEHEPLIKKTSTVVKNDIKSAESKKHDDTIRQIGENTPKKENIVKDSAVITPSKVAQNTINKQTSNTEKQSANTLPQTGNKDNMGILALGLALFSVGLGLIIKPKQDK